MTKPQNFIDSVLAMLRGVQHEPIDYAQPPPTTLRRGFGEGRVSRLTEIIDDTDAAPPTTGTTTAPTHAPDDPALPFPSTGPRGHRGRMRQRVLTHGASTLADYELLEMLLFFAFKTGDTKPLAKSLINRYGSFASLLATPADQLLASAGLGQHSVVALKLVQDAALRLARAEVMDKPILNNWERLMDYLTAMLAREKIEQFRILFLDPRNRLIADEAQARGTVDHTPVYPREVVKRALELHATALILVHNHPSGDPSPSRADIEMTSEIKHAAQVLGVVLHDHVIVGNGRWLSFRREGLLA